MMVLKALWMILMGLMMNSLTTYVFQFKDSDDVVRLPYAKWNRIWSGDEIVKEYSNQPVYIAYTYLSLENKKPVYCSRIDGEIYYFDKEGRIILNKPHCLDIFQDLDEEAGGVINLQHRKKKKEVADKYYWELNPQQIQQVLECIW